MEPLPAGPTGLCFRTDHFVKEAFSVDQFLQEHRRKAHLEALRDDLGVYLKVLRAAMIELINKDYADFVNLSSNLIGLDKAIDGLQVPLGQLKEEVMVSAGREWDIPGRDASFTLFLGLQQVKLSLEEAMAEVSVRLEERRRLRERKQDLQNLAEARELLGKLRTLLEGDGGKRELPTPDLVERAASQYNQLRFSMSKCEQRLVASYLEEVEQLSSHLMSSLDAIFLRSVRDGDAQGLAHSLRIYVALDRVASAEDLFRREEVAAAMHVIICEAALAADPRGLRGIYEGILGFVRDTMASLLDITVGGGRPTVRGFDFLVNSLWPEVEHRLEVHLPSIYAPGNPDMFFQRYSETTDFLSLLERSCGTQARVRALHTHPQFTTFLQRWNLPVYFQIRFQEIAGAMETVLSDPGVATQVSPTEDMLAATVSTLEAAMKCWEDGVFIRELGHRFWKLTLQILSRYCTWVGDILQERWATPDKMQFLVRLYADVEKLGGRLSTLEGRAVGRLGDIPEHSRQLLHGSIAESQEQLSERLSVVSQHILSEASSEGLVQLRQVSDIPRLFRRTNREVPSRPCPYVHHLLAAPATFRAAQEGVVAPQLLHHWLRLIMSAITTQYHAAVTDVLTSVQRTEESLRRLKKLRERSATGTGTGRSLGVGDDDKIRRQLAVDVHSYRQGVCDLGLEEDDVDDLAHLVALVESAAAGPDAK